MSRAYRLAECGAWRLKSPRFQCGLRPDGSDRLRCRWFCYAPSGSVRLTIWLDSDKFPQVLTDSLRLSQGKSGSVRVP